VADDVDDVLTAAVERLDAALVVVTVAVDGERDGSLVGFHSQASIDPPRYVVWLSVANRTTRLAAGAEHLGVHVLSATDHALAALFGGTTDDDPGPAGGKLEQVAWTEGPGGVPLLDAVPVRFVGRVLEWLRPAGADHHGAVLEPVAGRGADDDDRHDPSVAAAFRLHQAHDITPGHPA
jgi:flavin reductase (DIM6/NTAB) family NADH-FMN oxidoreductase RutF